MFLYIFSFQVCVYRLEGCCHWTSPARDTWPRRLNPPDYHTWKCGGAAGRRRCKSAAIAWSLWYPAFTERTYKWTLKSHDMLIINRLKQFVVFTSKISFSYLKKKLWIFTTKELEVVDKFVIIRKNKCVTWLLLDNYQKLLFH